MPARQDLPTAPGSMVVAAAAIAAMAVVVLLFPMPRGSWDVWAAVFIGPAVFFASLPAFARQARREGERRVYTLLIVALLAKLVFSVLRWHHAFNVVEKADAQAYDRIGGEIALRFLQGDFTTGLANLYDTNFIRFFTGGLYTVIRPSALGGFLIYAWLAFWGSYFFYRAFVLAVPGNRRSYAKWLFFMPSMLFWPSSIGKESWLMFGIGIAAFGAAKLLTGRFVTGIVIAGTGLGLAALVRAPIAVMFGLALVVAAVLRRRERGVRTSGPVAKAAALVVYAVIGVVLVLAMQRYLVRSGFAADGLDAAIQQSQRVTATGGSEFTPAPINTPIGLVMNIVTVLFRPFFFEANTAESLVTSVEASVLLAFSALRFRSLLTALRSLRRLPYTLLATIYVLGSIVALSPVANFGIIARQRVLLYPMYLVLICLVPPPARGSVGARVVPSTDARQLVGART
jgi:hypothetical protein